MNRKVLEMDNKTLMQRLDANGRTGADLSPGDPVCAAAAWRIRELERTLRALADEVAIAAAHGIVLAINNGALIDAVEVLDTEVKPEKEPVQSTDPVLTAAHKALAAWAKTDEGTVAIAEIGGFQKSNPMYVAFVAAWRIAIKEKSV